MQENILSKKLSLGLDFSTPSGGVTSPSLKESMAHTVVACLVHQRKENGGSNHQSKRFLNNASL